MKALVLSGGAGTRLRPFTYSTPKQLVPVANKPVLQHCLENVRAAGITEVGIIVGAQGAEIRQVIGDGADLGLRVTYLQQSAPLGLAHCVLIAREFLGDDDFLLYLGDNILVGGVNDLVEGFRRTRPAAQLAVTKVRDPREYGVAELSADGAVVGLVEKPVEPRSDLAVIGVYLFTPAIHEAVRSITPSWRDELEITDAVRWLVEQGHDVRGEVFTGYWKDTGRIEDLLACNEVLLEAVPARIDGLVDEASELTGSVSVEVGARIVRSTVVGPVVIGANAVIEDSYVGPYSAIGADCVVSDGGLEYSILLDGASVRGVRGLHSSLVGRATEITRRTDELPRKRLIVGDHTRVELHN